VSGPAPGKAFVGSKVTPVLLLAGIIGLLSLYFYFAASNQYSGSFSDSVRYLFMADYFRGATDSLTVLMAQESMFPPLFPLMLSMFGAGTENIAGGHLVTVLTLALACAAFFWWLTEQQLRLNERLLLLLLLLLLPGIFFHSLVIASEFLFLALVLASLAAMKKSNSSDKWILVAAILVGLSIATRTIGIALLPSLFLACRAFGYRKLILAAVLSLAPYLLWQLLRESTFASIGYLEVFSLYLEQFSFSEIIHNLGFQLRLMWREWIQIYDRTLATQVVLIHSVLLAAVGVVFLARLAKLKSEAVFLLVYLGIIAFWPFPQELERFTVILVPVFLFYCLMAVAYFIAKFQLPAMGGLLKISVFAIILVSIVPSLLFTWHRYSLPAPREVSGHRFSSTWYNSAVDTDAVFTARKIESLYQMTRAIAEHVPEGECVYTTVADIVSLYSGRRGTKLPLDLYANAESGYGYDIKRLDQCDFVLMIGMEARPVREFVSMYPIRALDNHLDPILISNLTHNGAQHTAAAFAEIVR